MRFIPPFKGLFFWEMQIGPFVFQIPHTQWAKKNFLFLRMWIDKGERF